MICKPEQAFQPNSNVVTCNDGVIWEQIRFPVVPLPVQLLAHGLGKAWEYDPWPWLPDIHARDMEEALDS